MAIDFNALPTESTFKTLAPGLYKMTVKTAEAKTKKDDPSKEYLELQCSMVDANGNPAGTFYDRFFDSESEVPKYKLGRFAKATKLPITGVLTFGNFAKLLPGVTVIVDIKNVEDTYRSNGAMKAEVDLFAREAYWPIDEWEALTGNAPAAPAESTGGNY